MTDILTVVWREWKELFASQGRWKGGMFNFVLVSGVFGILLPMQMGRGWVASPTMLLNWVWVPLLLLSNIVVDAVAGERERHTLETLLASRLPDSAIALGKIAAGVLYGLLLSATSLALGLVTVNAIARFSDVVVFGGATLIIALTVCLLGGVFIGGLGVLVSLRAATVRQASQLMGVAVIATGFAPIALMRLARRVDAEAFQAFAAEHTRLLAIGLLAMVTLIDVGVIGLVLMRFRRTKLLAD